jgi:hypothetical protein
MDQGSDLKGPWESTDNPCKPFGEIEPMRRFRYAAWGALALCLLLVDNASAFRCGARLANAGDTKWEIAHKCGPPTWVDRWEEVARVENGWGRPYPGGDPRATWRGPYHTFVYMAVEEWTYNLGPNQFMRILRFENNRLVDIQTGGYGF